MELFSPTCIISNLCNNISGYKESEAYNFANYNNYNLRITKQTSKKDLKQLVLEATMILAGNEFQSLITIAAKLFLQTRGRLFKRQILDIDTH